MAVLALEHVQIAMPPGGEEAARRFYVEGLGMAEAPKPEGLAGRGGYWFAGGAASLPSGWRRSSARLARRTRRSWWTTWTPRRRGWRRWAIRRGRTCRSRGGDGCTSTIRSGIGSSLWSASYREGMSERRTTATLTAEGTRAEVTIRVEDAPSLPPEGGDDPIKDFTPG